MEKKNENVAALSYSEAVAELEKILSAMQSSAADIDTLAENTRRATLLIKHCREKLLKTEKELEEAGGES